MRLPIMHNTNLHPISHLFKVIVEYWSNLYFRRGYLALTLIRDEALNSRLRNLT